MLLVAEEVVEQAVFTLLEIEKTVVEGAGAVGLAAVCANPEKFAGRKTVLVLSGGNVDMMILSSILQRGLVRSHRLVRLRLEVPDVPGALAELTRVVGQIEAASRGASFNRAHEVLSAFQKRFERVWILTQNVDGFHRKAGSTNVIDIHGDVHRILCTSCDYRMTVDDYTGLSPLPMCPECPEPLRPDVVLFGELLPIEKVELMERELDRGFDVVFSIGTTSVFPYIVRPVLDAKQRGKATVEINPGTTMLSGEVDVQLPLGAVEALDSLWDRLGTV